ncbi:hypothetical protein BOTBODRAFT_40450 [Botryobasidium botryosum FD-172 SS1]|uniref:Lysine-specific metallo-endopeptidase domain-containing protein n=1 Tax=Botryobasidium botryosum (strain FD-172 SS1) TaxID=930990 RepID=A0A067N1C4_BOTB1|nr:hypothetical protein BOTBODRAFT_40450 [Botryobasidium botryosum FD-172 SS1]
MLACALALSLQLTSLVVAAPSFSVSVSSPQLSVNGVSNLHVTAAISNTGSETLRLLKDPSSILRKDWETDSFRFTQNGTNVAPNFLGAMVKWSPELAAATNAVTTIAPGQTVEVAHDLSTRYDFSALGAGVFDIHAYDTFTHIDEAGNYIPLQAAVSTPVSVAITGSLNAVRTPVRSAKFAKRANFKGCSAAQETDIDHAVGAASELSTGAFNYFSSRSKATLRYETWFGKFDPTRFNTVKANYKKIAAVHLSAFTYDCGCPHQDAFAYVYPEKFGEVYLCPAFFKAPPRGSDSQAGTIVHEVSHFTKTAATKDLAYGKTKCATLAKNRPKKAITNADNIEYFAENDPALS